MADKPDTMKFLSIPLLIFASLSASPQTIHYSYDQSGNRISREIVMTPQNIPSNETASVNEDVIDNRKLNIYPNPTYGILTVEIRGYENSDNCGISIFNKAGTLITEIKLDSHIATIDISDQPADLYLMRIIINQSVSTWRIIKL